MSDHSGAEPSGSRWMARSVVIGLVGVALTTLGVMALAEAVPRRIAVVLALGLPLLAVGVASLAAAMRVEARHHAVAVLRPHDDVVEVSLGDGWVDALPSAGVEPGPVGIALLRHVTAAVGDEGVGLWTGGARPSLAAVVPWSAVADVALGASTTVNGASAPAVALALPGGSLLLVPRRGASGDGWGAPEDAVRLAERWAWRRAGGGELDADPVDLDLEAGLDLDLDLDPTAAEPAAPAEPTRAACAESIEDRIRRLAGTDR